MLSNFFINNHMIIKEYRKKYSYNSSKYNKIVVVNEKMLLLNCDQCGHEHSRVKKHYRKMKKNPHFTQDLCNKCWQSFQNKLPERRKKNSDAQKKRYLDPLERKKTRIASKGNNSGDKNAMKREHVRKKVSETRSQLMKNPEFRKKFVQGTINAWKRGAYEIVNDVNCRTKWHVYIHSSGKEYRVQGTWELKFIQWLDENNLTFDCHKGRLPYIDVDGVERSYYPDFFVYEWNSYVDPKADYWYKKQYEKFELIKKQHPNKNIQILTKQKLLELGIKV